MSDSNFGHMATVGKIGSYAVRMDSWGDGPFVLEVDGKSFRFEDSDRFGTSLLTKSNEVAKNPSPGVRSPFWRAHRIWVRQGRRTEEFEDHWKCVWDEPKPRIVNHIGGRNYWIEESGDPDGKTIFAEPKDSFTEETK